MKVNKNISIFFGALLSFKVTAYFTILYRFIGVILTQIDIFISLFEKLFFSFIKKKLKEPKLIFVIGTHRSGATFFAQTLLINTNYNNLSNFQLIFKRSTFFSNYLKIKFKKILFRNFYGQTFRLSDVSDLNEFWNYHLNLKDNEFIDNKNFKCNPSIKNFLQEYYSYDKRPIIIKNGRNLFISRKLYNFFRKSYFIFVKRDIKYINKSIKKARSVFMNYDWGLKIKNNKNFNKLDVEKKNLILEKTMLLQINSFKKNRYSIVNFEKFKKNKRKETLKIIKKIDEFFK